MTILFATLSGIIHIYIFVLESIKWGTPKVNKAFQQDEQSAEITRSFAYNQGFYNLFLAFGSLAGSVLLILGKNTVVAQTLLIYANASMLAAALVLITSNKSMVRPASIQGLPPLLAILGCFL